MAGTKKSKIAKLSVVTVVLALLVLGAGSALARIMGHGPFGGAHGAFGLGAHVGHLMAELDLTAEQKAYLDNVHAIVGERHGSRAESHGEHLQTFIDRIEEGTLDPAEVNLAIDEHLEQARILAYDVASELVTFANSLDDDQRQLLVERLREVSERLEEHGGHPLAFRNGHGMSDAGD